MLWSCGICRSEITRLLVEDVNLVEEILVISQPETGNPPVVQLSPSVRQGVRRLLRGRSGWSVSGMSTDPISLCLMRLDAPSDHAWRKGRAVQALRSGVSETSVWEVAC